MVGLAVCSPGNYIHVLRWVLKHAKIIQILGILVMAFIFGYLCSLAKFGTAEALSKRFAV